MKVEFEACESLDFKPNYTAKRQMLAGGKLFWIRPVLDSSYPSMVQFCKKRGRQNSPTACLCEKDKMCNDYKTISHIIEVPKEELD